MNCCWLDRATEACGRGNRRGGGEAARRQDVSVILERKKQKDRKIEGEEVELSSS